ncbi:D-alanyl-D-alanine carboxypeptidase family protein [Ferdinandcohnia quinoae]|uniref:D-alanyl-D-alanine carboxypeptidase n=1 Tax=Fredinandcohnia quinoae TaxID=2918902 RepID=A0AAW5EBA6_9BACI|nr:D-alanyl-D-alanine carboxypeptidase [Fredinandcohnia sp. SECRCQ15]MCH1626726.1 D-alanyl-D-alanine carboxypeptidase [Fredinandcohnia sp. SECRCQ15]
MGTRKLIIRTILLLGIMTVFIIAYGTSEKSNISIQDKLIHLTKNIQLKDSEKSESELSSTNAILVRLTDNKIVEEKDSQEVIYPASLTKIMTTLVAIESISNVKERVILPDSMFTRLYEENASMAGYLPNEEIAAIDLLYGIMLPSGAEASVGLATYIAGSEESFVQLMNEKAEQLGMDNTHFTNVTGLHNPDHYTTVKDLSILLKVALKNDTFRTIFTAERYSTSPTNLHPDGITFKSTMFKNIGTNELDNGQIIGGKTGYTEEAGLCLASLAEINGEEYILITTGAPGNHQTEQFNITDALLVYGEL